MAILMSDVKEKFELIKSNPDGYLTTEQAKELESKQYRSDESREVRSYLSNLQQGGSIFLSCLIGSFLGGLVYGSLNYQPSNPKSITPIERAIINSSVYSALYASLNVLVYSWLIIARQRGNKRVRLEYFMYLSEQILNNEQIKAAQLEAEFLSKFEQMN
jgi:hypothetical protein